MHHKYMIFVLKRFNQQIYKFQFDILDTYKSICIIANEWSDSASHKYCSVSASVMENLKFGIIFLRYYREENIRARTISDVTIKVF